MLIRDFHFHLPQINIYKLYMIPTYNVTTNYPSSPFFYSNQIYYESYKLSVYSINWINKNKLSICSINWINKKYLRCGKVDLYLLKLIILLLLLICTDRLSVCRVISRLILECVSNRRCHVYLKRVKVDVCIVVKSTQFF